MNESKTDELVEFGKVTEETKGMWPCGDVYDGGNAYYYNVYPGCPFVEFS